jgi:hypothetical protein
MAQPSSWERAVQEAKEAELAASACAEAVRAERWTRRTTVQALAAQRHPLLQAYGRALQAMVEKWERAWIEWNESGPTPARR